MNLYIQENDLIIGPKEVINKMNLDNDMVLFPRLKQWIKKENKLAGFYNIDNKKANVSIRPGFYKLIWESEYVLLNKRNNIR